MNILDHCDQCSSPVNADDLKPIDSERELCGRVPRVCSACADERVYEAHADRHLAGHCNCDPCNRYRMRDEQ